MISRSLPKSAKVQPSQIQEIGVIFKTHLDLGFTNLAGEVYRRYMDDFLPRAVDLAVQTRHERESFIWTTGSWLVHKYLHHCRGQARRNLITVLGEGRIRWHALPFTFQTEALDDSLWEAAFRFSADLDAEFGVQTRAAKMTDVPGHTRGIIPGMAAAGVDFLHIGVNPASPVPKTPDLFRWQHPGGAEITVCCDGTYGGFCVIPGRTRLFAISMTGDNAGPPGLETIRKTYRDLQLQFPGARIHATNLEELADAVRSARDSLPVVRSEIGDTWIHGYGSDPWKMAALRTLARARHEWISRSRLNPDSKSGRAFDEQMLLAMEHTWGLDEKTWLNNGKPLTKIPDGYRREEFAVMRKLPAFRRMEASWEEQRGYIRAAIAALPARLQKEASRLVKPLCPRTPGTRKEPTQKPRQPASLQIGGTLLHPCRDGSWQLPGQRGWLGLLTYEVFGGDDYAAYLKKYVSAAERNGVWAPFDFSKPGCGRVLKSRRVWVPRVCSRTRTQNGALACVLLFPRICREKFGAPAEVRLTVSPVDKETLRFEAEWFGKAATRMGEALWFSFRFPVATKAGWWMDKLGGRVDPFDVVPRGNRHLHIVHQGAGVESQAEGAWSVESLEAALVAPGRPCLVDFDTTQPDPHQSGLHFNLFNNTWGTNFPAWYDDNARFVFTVRHMPPKAGRNS